MTIGVDRKAVSFNKAICAKMGIGPDSKITFLVDDRGFLAINVLDKESPTGIGLRRSSKKVRHAETVFVRPYQAYSTGPLSHHGQGRGVLAHWHQIQ